MTGELPLYNKILVVLVDFIGIALAFGVYKYNPKKQISKIFLVNIILMFLWVNFAYLARLIDQRQTNLALIYLKIAWFVTPLFFASLYFLIAYFLNKEKKYSTLSKIILFIGIIAALTAGLTNLVVKEIEFVGTDLIIIYGRGMIPFFAVTFFLMYAALFLLGRDYLKSASKKRVKLEYLLAGISIFYLANLIFNIFFPTILKIAHYYWIGDYSSIVLLGFIGYAIIKHQLFDIKIILTQFLVGIFAFLLVIEFFFSISIFEYIRNGILFLIFLFFGYLLIKSAFREIKDKRKIESLGKKLLEKEKAFHKTFEEIAGERGRRLENVYMSSIYKDAEIDKLKARIYELEEKLEEKENV